MRMTCKAGVLNEDPLKEVRCLAYLTRKLREGGLPGDPSRVLPMLDCMEDSTHIYLVMPALRQEMFTVVEARNGPFPEPEVFAFLRDFLGGLEAAHALGLAHHDVSLENLMLHASGRPVIIDWGMVVKVPLTDRGVAVKIAPRDGWPCRCGKDLYIAPELQSATDAFDPFALDRWAVGIMLYILLTGRPPWKRALYIDEDFSLIIRGELHLHLAKSRITHLSADAVALVQALLLEDPGARPTIAQIRAFAWFQRKGLPP
jgi:serine/threonine protein kinase